VGRYPLRMFPDTQIAVAEVFGNHCGTGNIISAASTDPGSGRDQRRNDGGGGGKAGGDQHSNTNTRRKGAGSNANVYQYTLEAPAVSIVLYTDFVMKLELALSKPRSKNDTLNPKP